MSLTQAVDEVVILETREASPSHFLMKIESFSLLRQHEIRKYETGEFSAGGHMWKLILCSNDEETGVDSNYVSVSLAISNTTGQPANWEVNGVFSIFLLNQISGNYHYSPGRTRRFQAVKPEWGIKIFISTDVLTDPSNGFLIDDNCVFGAEVFIVKTSAVFECLSLKNQTLPFKHDWKLSNFSGLGDTWTSEQFDVDGLMWEVNINPKGKGLERGRNVAAYIRYIGSRRVMANFSMCVKSQSNDASIHYKLTSRDRWFSPLASSWGWPRFMKLATLEDSNYEYIINDCCILDVELSVLAVV